MAEIRDPPFLTKETCAQKPSNDISTTLAPRSLSGTMAINAFPACDIRNNAKSNFCRLGMRGHVGVQYVVKVVGKHNLTSSEHIELLISRFLALLGKTAIVKKRFLSGIARMMGGGSTHARIRSAFLVNKKSLFLQKCQYIELLTVF